MMNEREFEQEKLDGEVPEELQHELDRMQKRERMYTFAVAGALSLALLFGFNWYRGQQSEFASYSYNNSAGYVSNATTGAGGGGCCAPGGSVTSTAPAATDLSATQQKSAAGGGGCGSGGASSTPTDLGTVEQEGLAYYQETYKDTDVTAKAKDYGCHVQCDIVKDGEVIKSFSYRGGQLSEI